MSVCEPSPRRASWGTVGAAGAALSLFIHMWPAGGSSARTCGGPRGSASDVDTLDLFNTHADGRGRTQIHVKDMENSWRAPEKPETVRVRKTGAASSVGQFCYLEVSLSALVYVSVKSQFCLRCSQWDFFLIGVLSLV